MSQMEKKERPVTSVTDQEALEFHAMGRPGKLEINPTKPMATQRDLSLAYSPGVAVPGSCLKRKSPHAHPKPRT